MPPGSSHGSQYGQRTILTILWLAVTLGAGAALALPQLAPQPLLLTVLGVLALIGVIGVAMMAIDKSRAASGRGDRRIPEASLHLLTLIGGSPLMVPAMLLLRHKTQKAGFHLITMLILLAQAAAIGAVIWWRFQPAS